MKFSSKLIRVVIADDHEIFRDGLINMIQKIPELECVGEAENGRELIQIIGKKLPDVVLTDIKMPVMDGVTATKIINENFPSVKIIALSMIDESVLVSEMLEAGANGYLLKNAHKNQIIEAIRKVNDGEQFYSNQVVHLMADAFKRKRHEPDPKDLFSQKELEIIRLICKEYSSKEIATELHVSVRTIDSHRIRIMEKMEVRNVAGVVNYCHRNKLYPVNE